MSNNIINGALTMRCREASSSQSTKDESMTAFRDAIETWTPLNSSPISSRVARTLVKHLFGRIAIVGVTERLKLMATASANPSSMCEGAIWVPSQASVLQLSSFVASELTVDRILLTVSETI
jgi:hypothetical protein